MRASCGLEAHQGIEVEDVAVAMVEFANGARGNPGKYRLLFQYGSTCIHTCVRGQGIDPDMCDDKFDLWDLRNPLPRDEEILERFGVGAVQAGSRCSRY